MSRPLSDEIIEKAIIAIYLDKKGPTEIANLLGISRHSVSAINMAFALIREESWEELAKRIQNDIHMTKPIVFYCAKRLGKQFPTIVESAIGVRDQKIREKTQKRRSEKEKTIFQESLDLDNHQSESPKEENNEQVFFCRVLEELMRLNENVEQFMDVVIPKYVVDLKDCINANADVLQTATNGCEKHLEKIAFNTRKRGV